MKIKTMFAAFAAILLVGSLIGVNTLLAEKRYEVAEMADGNDVRFKVQPDDSLATAKTGPQEPVSQDAGRAEKWVEKVEMADGHYVEFKMSPDEIKMAKFRRERQMAEYEASQASVSPKDNACVETIEMADGHVAVFPISKESESYLACVNDNR